MIVDTSGFLYYIKINKGHYIGRSKFVKIYIFTIVIEIDLNIHG